MRNVRVNGEFLLPDELRARMTEIRQEREAMLGPLSLEERLTIQEEALQLLIDRTLIIQEARRLSLTAEETEVDAALSNRAARYDGVQGCRAGADTTEARAEMQRRILVDKVLDQWRSRVRKPRLGELRDYYRMNQQQFHFSESVHAAHIVCHFNGAANEDAVRERTETLHARVRGGEPFGRIASGHSDCPEKGGDLGWFARGLMVEDFDNAVFNTPGGELTPVFRTDFGFHFALVHARRPAGVQPFDAVRPAIESALWRARQDQEVKQALAALRAQAEISIAPARSNA